MKSPKSAANMDCRQILEELRSQGNPANVAGMARYGINPSTALGVTIPTLRKVAARAGKDHVLAEELWASGVHEARILATMIDSPKELTEEQLDRWVMDFNSWDLCDQCCNNLFRKWPGAHAKASQWSDREEEFVKRAGFTLMACLAVHDKTAADSVFLDHLAATLKASTDPRNYVKKAVNWALRQIGKRNLSLNAAALDAARSMARRDSKAARWIASDAIRELTSDAVLKRLQSR